jgi:hypothetical protein
MANVRSAPTRQDTFTVIVHLNGVSLGVWDKKSGGRLDSDEVKYYPGGMASPISLGGRVNPDDVTLQRNYDRKDDHDKIDTLYNAVGKGQVTVSQRPMDKDGNLYGRPIIWTGILKSIMVPDVDSEATGPALIEMVVAVQGTPAAV